MSISSKIKVLRELLASNRRTLKIRNASKPFNAGEAQQGFDLGEMLAGHQAVFTLSTGRCGTMLLAELLGLSDDCHVQHHAEPELSLANRYAFESGSDHNPEGLRLALLAARGEHVLEAHRIHRRYVETNRYLTFFARGLQALLPRAKFIHLVRDPQYFIRSGLARNYYEPALWNACNIQPDIGETGDDDSLTIQVHRIAAFWVETNQFIETFKANAPADVCLTLRSDELFDVPETTQSIFEFLDLSAPDSATISRMIQRPRNASAPSGRKDAFPCKRLVGYKQLHELAEAYGFSVDWIEENK